MGDGQLNEGDAPQPQRAGEGELLPPDRGSGSHNLVAGFDAYDNMRLANTYGSGSGYRVHADVQFHREFLRAARIIFPVFNNATRIVSTPLVADSSGGHLKTYSGFLNDVWQISPRFTANLGLRYDRNDDRDQAGNKFTSDAALSPRLSLSFTPTAGSNMGLTSGFAGM